MAGKFTKDPQAVLDYGYDWTAWLAGDTIATSTWAVLPLGASLGGTLTPSLPTFNPTGKTTVWLTGGVAGEKYTVKNHIVTAAGRSDDRTFTVTIKDL